MKQNRFVLLVAVYLLSGLPSAFAANVNVVHGINGRDLGLTRDLPVDIAVNGTCALKGVTFTKSALVELTPASYQITVHLADGSCSQSPVISQNIVISNNAGRSFSIVASLSQAGKPQLALFNNSREQALSPTVSVRHLAFAGDLVVKFSSSELLRSQTQKIKNRKTSNLGILATSFNYTVNIFNGKRARALARLSGTVGKRNSIYNIVGSERSGFSIIKERPIL